MVKFLLVRHGQSEANQKGYFAGQLDSPLTELGMQQASCAARYIAGNYAIDAVYSSDLQRAAVLGRLISDAFGVDLKFDSRLREIDAGSWQGCSFDQLRATFPEYQTWLQDIGNVQCDGGESVEQLQLRVSSALIEIAQLHTNQTIAITTHATPIRAIQCLASGKALSQMKQIPWVTNTSITELLYVDDRFTMGKVSFDAFLGNARSGFSSNV